MLGLETLDELGFNERNDRHNTALYGEKHPALYVQIMKKHTTPANSAKANVSAAIVELIVVYYLFLGAVTVVSLSLFLSLSLFMFSRRVLLL